MSESGPKSNLQVLVELISQNASARKFLFRMTFIVFSFVAILVFGTLSIVAYRLLGGATIEIGEIIKIGPTIEVPNNGEFSSAAGTVGNTENVLTEPSSNETVGESSDSVMPKGGQQSLLNVSYHWMHFRTGSAKVEDCIKLTDRALSEQGFTNLKSNFNAFRASKEIRGEQVVAWVQCLTSANEAVLTGFVISDNPELSKAEGNNLFGAFGKAKDEIGAEFVPPGNLDPNFWVTSRSLDREIAATREQCGQVAAEMVSLPGATDVGIKYDYSFATLGDNRVVAFCLSSGVPESFSIAVAVHGNSGADVEALAKAALQFPHVTVQE